MNDSKPTCGWNEAKPYSAIDLRYDNDLNGLRRMQEEIEFRHRSDGTEPITAEWLIEKWGGELFEVINTVHLRKGDTVIAVTSNGFIYFYGCYTVCIRNPPKTRDEFRSFAKFFGLEEKK